MVAESPWTAVYAMAETAELLWLFHFENPLNVLEVCL